MRYFLMAALVPLALFVGTGCDGGPRVVPVKGVVTRGGQPFKSWLVVTFYPEGDQHPSTGQTDAQGRFELRYNRETKGAVLGKHKVVVAFRPASPAEETGFLEGKTKYHPDQDAILEKFGNRETTVLEVEITNSGKDIELKLD